MESFFLPAQEEIANSNAEVIAYIIKEELLSISFVGPFSGLQRRRAWSRAPVQSGRGSSFAPKLNVSTRFFIRVAAPYILVAWYPCKLVEVRG